MNAQFVRLIESICERSFSKDDPRLKSVVKQFVDFYKENPRHEYSAITEFVFSKEEDEIIEILIMNLNRVREFFEKEQDKFPLEQINKLIDHTKLALCHEKIFIRYNKYHHSFLW